MKIAFLILAHKNPHQLQMLCDYLLENDADVFLHIDLKHKKEFIDFIKINSSRENLHLYSEFSVGWGSFSQINATVFLLKKAVENCQFDFVNLISGQDLPIKPLNDLKKFLSENMRSSFMSCYRLPAPEKLAGNGGLDRVELYWFNSNKVFQPLTNKLNVVVHTFQRLLRMKRGWTLPIYSGSNWFTLNFEMCSYMLRYFDEHPQYIRKYRFTRLADEIIVQTILMNSEYASDIVNENLRLLEWDKDFRHPVVFRITDAEKILSSKAFFARKFDETVDTQIIKLILSKI